VPALDAQVRSRLPDRVTLPGLDADGMRVAVRDGWLTPEALQRVEQAFRDLAAQRLAGFAPQGLEWSGGFAPGTLDARWVSDPLDGDPPLDYEAQGQFAIPLGAHPQHVAAATVGGPVLMERTLTFDLPRIEGMDTTYRVTLPPGIALADLQLVHATATQSREDGRDTVLITPTADDAQGAFTVAVTGQFVLTEFWYVWAALGLLAAGGIAVALVRRKRKGRGKVAPEAPLRPA
jgi:hypothetical protein